MLLNVLKYCSSLKFNRETRSWKDKMVRQERKAADEAEDSAEEARKKGRIIADLSEQLKESDDRIQDLTLELDSLREKQSADFATNNQESISKFVVVRSNQSISKLFSFLTFDIYVSSQWKRNSQPL